MKNHIFVLSSFLTIACGGGESDSADVVLLDEASDEVLETLQDAVERNLVTSSDDLSSRLLTPVDNAQVAAADPVTFSWVPPPITTTHGRETGDFVWLHLECPGMQPIDVLAIETMEYTPDAEHWQKISATTGECTSTLTTAFVDRGVVMEGGPFRPLSNPTFSVLP